MKVVRVLITPDKHFPLEDKVAWDGVIQYAGQHRWDYHVDLGDTLDLSAISGFNAGQPGKIENLRLRDDFVYAEERYAELASAVRAHNPTAHMVYLEGNHEFRVQRFLDQHPYLEGLISVQDGLDLKGKGVEWVPCYSERAVYRIGSLRFLHGTYHNLYHARKHAQEYGVSVVYGHAHSIQSHAVRLEGRLETVVASSLGCLCDLEQPYRSGRPGGLPWEHAFGVAHVREDGTHNLYTVRIHPDGSFVGPDGREYQGRKRK